MGFKKLTQLTEITSLPNDALIYVVSGGTSYKITKANLLAGISSGSIGLSDVTGNDNTTSDGIQIDTNNLNVNQGYVSVNEVDNSSENYNKITPAYIGFSINETIKGTLSKNNLTAARGWELPDYNGTLTTEEKVAEDLAPINAKLSYISITQAVDLDAIETRVNELDAAVILKGTWSAASGSFPSSAQAGWSYLVSADGTVDGIEFKNGDRLICVLDNASTTTYASNWYKADYTDRVNSVCGRTGNVTITSSDLSDFNTAVNALIATALANYSTTSQMNAALALKSDIDGTFELMFHCASSNVGDYATLYMGGSNNLPLSTTNNRFETAGITSSKLRATIYIYNTGTLGTSEDLSITLMNVTQTTEITLTTTAKTNSTSFNHQTGQLTFAITQGDNLAIRLNSIAIATNPTNVLFGVRIMQIK